VPAHKGIEGNEEADQQAMKEAYKHRRLYTEMRNPLKLLDDVSFTHVIRKIKEMKWNESNNIIQELGAQKGKAKHGYRYDLVKRGGDAIVMKAQKSIAVRYNHLKSGHRLLAMYFK